MHAQAHTIASHIKRESLGNRENSQVKVFIYGDKQESLPNQGFQEMLSNTMIWLLHQTFLFLIKFF